MNPTNNYNIDSTVENREFTKSEYQELLVNLNEKKPNSTLLIKNNSLEVVGTVTRIWETLKGWLGFENNTNIVKVNYQLLKIVQYGENHYYLEDSSIKSLLNDLKLKLNNDERHKKIAVIIQQILNNDLTKQDNLDTNTGVVTQVREYQRDYGKQLKESFWPRLFHTYVSPLKVDNSWLQYNIGRRQFFEGKFTEAALSFEQAISSSINKPDWQLLLAKSYLAKANQDLYSNVPGDVIPSFNKVIDALSKIQEYSCDPTLWNNVEKVRADTLSKIRSCEISKDYNLGFQRFQQNKFDEAIPFLEKAIHSSPEKVEWQFLLAKSFLGRIDQDAHTPTSQKIHFCNQSLAILNDLDHPKYGQILLQDVKTVKNTALAKKNTLEALNFYEKGLLEYNQKKFTQAIYSFEQALKITPGKSEWLILLAQAHLQKSQASSKESIADCNEALNILVTVNISTVPSAQQTEIRKIQKEAIIKKIISYIHNDDFNLGVEAILEGAQLFKVLTRHFWEHEVQSRLNGQLSKAQMGKILIELGGNERISNNLIGAQYFTLQATNFLYVASRSNPDHQISELLIRVYLELGNQGLISQTEEGFDDAEQHINGAYAEFEHLREFYPPAAKSLVVGELTKAMRRLADAQRGKSDLISARDTMSNIQNVLKSSENENRSVLAEINHTKALIEEKNQNLFQAFIDAQKAFQLEQKNEYETHYLKLLNQISQTKNHIDSIPQECLSNFIASLESTLGHMQNRANPEWKLLLCKASMKKVDQLRKSKNYAEATVIVDRVINDLKKLSNIVDVKNLLEDAFVTKLICHVHLGEHTQAANTLRTASEVTKQDYQEILEEASPFGYAPHHQVGSLFAHLAHNPLYAKDAKNLLEQAAEQFKCEVNANFNADSYNQLIATYLDLSKLELSTNINQAENLIIGKAQAYLAALKEAAPQDPSIPSLNSRIISSLNELVEAYTQKAQRNDEHHVEYLQGAIRNVKLLKTLTSLNDRGESARLSYTLAKLEYQGKNYYDALLEANEAHRLDPATKSYKRLVEQYSSDVATQGQLADNYFKEGDFEKSLTCYLNCYKHKLQQYPEQKREIISHLMMLADSVIKKNNSVLAAKALEHVVPYFQELTIPHQKQIAINQLIADESRKTGDYAKAIHYYEAGLKLLEKYDHLNLEFLNQIAFCYKNNGALPSEVENIWKKAIERDPLNSFYLFSLGNHYEDNRQYNEALKAYEKAYNMQPDNPKYHQKLIEIEIHAGDRCFKAKPTVESLSNELQSFIKFATTKGAPLTNMLQSSIDKRWFTKFRWEYPAWTAFRKLGQLPATESERNAKIISDAEQAIHIVAQIQKAKSYVKINPEIQAQVEKRLSLIRQQLDEIVLSDDQFVRNQASEAIPHYIHASYLSNKEYNESYSKLIQAYVRNGDHKLAIDSYWNFKKQFPNHPILIPIQSYIAETKVLIDQKNYVEAIAWIKAASAQFPQEVELKYGISNCFYEIGEAFLNKKNSDKAVEYFLKAIDCGVNANPACYHQLGKLYNQANNSRIDLLTKKALDYESSKQQTLKASSLLRKAAELDPNNALYQFDFGQILYWENNLECNHFFRKATQLDKTKKAYFGALVFGLRINNENNEFSPEALAALATYKSLGGSVLHEEPWSDEFNPHLH